MVKKLKEKKNEIKKDLFDNIIFLIFFPLFGLIASIWYLIDSIKEIREINKKIKIEKIKDILRQTTVIKDENGNIKDLLI